MITSGYHSTVEMARIEEAVRSKCFVIAAGECKAGAQVMKSDKNDLANQVKKVRKLGPGAPGQQIWEKAVDK